MTAFEQHVVDSLARLETSMESLVGNGHPGRVAELERKVLYLIIGGVLLAVAQFGPMAVAAWIKP